MSEPLDLDAKLKARFNELPKPVQRAITSADVEKRLRALADSQKLHLDQWAKLENEVMMALFGATPIDELQHSIEKHVAVSLEVATILTKSINEIVFEPIREELERELGDPQAKEVVNTPIEAARTQVLAQEKSALVAPATPPTAAPTEKAVRAPISESYKAGEPSTTRKSVHDDPYREPPA